MKETCLRLWSFPISQPVLLLLAVSLLTLSVRSTTFLPHQHPTKSKRDWPTAVNNTRLTLSPLYLVTSFGSVVWTIWKSNILSIRILSDTSIFSDVTLFKKPIRNSRVSHLKAYAPCRQLMPVDKSKQKWTPKARHWQSDKGISIWFLTCVCWRCVYKRIAVSSQLSKKQQIGATRLTQQ